MDERPDRWNIVINDACYISQHNILPLNDFRRVLDQKEYVLLKTLKRVISKENLFIDVILILGYL